MAMMARSTFRTILSVVLVMLFVAICSAVDHDPYKILGVNRSASQKDIKKAFRKLTKLHHPDLHQEEAAKKEANDKYSEITKAYEILNDEDKRRLFDRAGHEGVKKGAGRKKGGNDPFNGMFNFGGFNFGGQFGQQGERKGPSVEVALPLTLKDIYEGKEFWVGATRQVECHGDCPRGRNTRSETEALHVSVEPGMRDNHKITFEGMGDESPDWKAGSFSYVIQTARHPIFTRQGNDLTMTVQISLKESLVGFKKTVEHVDGHEVEIGKNGVTSHASTQSFRGQGMPIHDRHGSFGSLRVTYHVQYPRTLTQEQKDAINAAF